MTKAELTKEIEKKGKNIIKSKDKIICYPYSLKCKGKKFTITKDKKVLNSSNDENEICLEFLSLVNE